MRIAGAKKVPLIGEPGSGDYEPQHEEPEPPKKRSRPAEPPPRGMRGQAQPAERPAGQGEQYPLRQSGKRSGMQHLSSTNIFGLSSRSEFFYPELFRPVSRVYWLRTTDEERDKLMERQAEIMKVVGYRETPTMHIPSTEADQAYDSALSRRHMAMRRRRRKPRTYEERKKFEEEQRKAPLVRRYIARDSRLSVSPIMTVSALETPVVITGLLRKAPAGYSAALGDMDTSADEKEREPPKLPVIDTKTAPSVAIKVLRNKFGLVPRAVSSYPEAYAKVSQAFWRNTTSEHREAVMRVQATAMEKVGFEQGISKFFISDFDPMQQNIYCSNRPQAKKQTKAGPTSLFAGVLLILVGLITGMPVILGSAPYGWLSVAVLLVGIGIGLILPARKRRM